MASRIEVQERRYRIWQWIFQQPDHCTSYKCLAEHFKVSEKTAKLDCLELVKEGYLKRHWGGVTLTEKGLNALSQAGSAELDSAIKRKHLRQLVILRVLARRRACQKRSKRSLTLKDISRLAGWDIDCLEEKAYPSLDSLSNDLAELTSLGLVERTDQGWQLGSSLVPPLYLNNDQMLKLYHYLNTLPAFLPLNAAQMTRIKDKLQTILLTKENMLPIDQLKLATREVVHGYSSPPPADANIVRLVEEAVAKGLVLELIYQGRKIKINPIGLVYHWRRGFWYIISTPKKRQRTNLQILRLDRVTSAHKTEEQFIRSPEHKSRISNFLAEYWGVSSDRRFEVEIRFFDTKWNVNAVENMLGEIAQRQRWAKTCRTETRPDGSVILKDTITGMSEFTAWLRTYGDAIEIISPAWLRETQKETAQKMLAVYKKKTGQINNHAEKLIDHDMINKADRPEPKDRTEQRNETGQKDGAGQRNGVEQIDKALTRLISLIKILEKHPKGLSANQLADLTGYPAAVILDDLNWIVLQSEFAAHYTLYVDDFPEEELDIETGSEALPEALHIETDSIKAINNSVKHSELIQAETDNSDEADYSVTDPDLKWLLVQRQTYTPGLNLSLEEAVPLLWALMEHPPGQELALFQKELRRRILPDHMAEPAENWIQFMGTKAGMETPDCRYLDQLRAAIYREQLIEVRYYAKQYRQTKRARLQPLGLVLYNVTGTWYLVAREYHGKDMTAREIILHLGRLESLRVLDQTASYPADFSLTDFLRTRWGMDMSDPVKVKARIYPQANVLEKINREMIKRGLPAPAEQADGTYLWEGEVRGINNFTRWILGYGSAVEILAPVKVRRKVISIIRNICRI
ncbi:MAG: WYL domain-containing transcriptional regulator [Syntrophomonadaceae bacterium]|nr:WYL domain-containing transcriptional regulator [Syntrophomonadaceae bacterium]